MSPPSREVADTRRAVRLALADQEPGALVLVACSGGADSLALAVATVWQAARQGLRVGAVTVDHGLQPGSGTRARELADRLVALGLDPVEVVAVAVDRAGGPEAAARRARYVALESVADRLEATVVLLGHTLDDQAETVLLRLARGSGARSLAGMRPVSGRYRRPFLALPRATVRATLDGVGQAAWEDPHNEDRTYLRPRVRHDVLPALEVALGSDVAAALARSADLLRADADALDAWAAQVRAEVVEDGCLDAVALAGRPEAVRTRVLRSLALDAGCPAGSLTAAHVHDLDALVAGWHGQGAAALPGGVSAVRDCGRLLLRRAPGDGPSEETRGR